MYKIKYAQQADFDLTSIFEHIAKDSRSRAINYLAEIEQTILKLKEFPNIGVESRYKEISAQGIKILVHDNYLIFHTIDDTEKTAWIIRVLHGSVNYKNKVTAKIALQQMLGYAEDDVQ